MKVSLWAEIRRLHEVERLSQARDCSAFALFAPYRPQGALDGLASHADARAVRKRPRPLSGADRRAAGKYPDLSAVRVREEITRGEDGYRGSVYPVRPVSAQDSARAGTGLPGGDLRAGRSHAGGLGRLRTTDDRPDAPAGLGLRGSALLQPDVLHRVQPRAAEGRLLPGLGPRDGLFSG